MNRIWIILKMICQPENVWKVGIILVLLTNLYGALPSFNYAPFEPANPNDVAVYERTNDSKESIAADIPVMRIDHKQPLNPFVDTGVRVQVWLRVAARDWEMKKIPFITVCILFATWICVKICARMRNTPT